MTIRLREHRAARRGRHDGERDHLWRSYLCPHAATVFSQCGRTDRDRHARRAVKWLRACGLQEVGRKDLRREAFGQAIDAADTDRVIQRLEQGGVVRPASVIRAPRAAAQHGRGGQSGAARVSDRCADCADLQSKLGERSAP